MSGRDLRLSGCVYNMAHYDTCGQLTHAEMALRTAGSAPLHLPPHRLMHHHTLHYGPVS